MAFETLSKLQRDILTVMCTEKRDYWLQYAWCVSDFIRFLNESHGYQLHYSGDTLNYAESDYHKLETTLREMAAQNLLSIVGPNPKFWIAPAGRDAINTLGLGLSKKGEKEATQ